MNNTLHQFKKIRTISEVLEDGFSFLQKHYRKMLKIIWESNKYYLLLFFILNIIFYYKYSMMINELLLNDKINNFGVATIFGLLISLYSIFLTARIYSAAYGYLKSYIKNNGEIKEEEIYNFINSKWLGYILLSFLSVIILFLGFLFFIIPGIYLLVPIVLSFTVYFMEGKGITEAISKAFSYIKGKWWYSFAIIMLTYIIIIILNSLVSFPATLYALIKIMGTVKTEGENISQATGDPVLAFLNVITIIAKLFISVIQVPVMVFLYFSLKEYQTAEGALEKINQIGS